MRKLLYLSLIFLFLAACKEEEEPLPDPSTKFKLNVMKQKMSSSGQITVEPIRAIIQVWKAENRDFDVAASPDIHVGDAYDRVSDSFHSIEYGAIGSKMHEEIKPGRYFLYVLLPKSAGNGSLAYSYTYFEIKQGRNLNIVKTFSHDIGAGMHEEWNKNK